MSNIRQLDLNLLKAFDALIRTGSVTAAAAEMSVGQSAMSHSLARLREQFDDQLFLRTAAGMEPTARARELAEKIGPILSDISNKVLAPAKFDPSLTHHHFTIALSDYLEIVLLPELLAAIFRQAPEIQLRVVHLDLTRYGELLDAGKIDFAIGMVAPRSSWHRTSHLFSESRQCVFAPARARLPCPVSLDDYLQAGHVVHSLAANTESFIDDELAKLGKSRKVRLSVPRFSTLPGILQNVPLIATLPTRLVDYCLQFDGLAASPLPIPAPDFDISVIWHARNDRAAAYVWFREHLSHTVLNGKIAEGKGHQTTPGLPQ